MIICDLYFPFKILKYKKGPYSITHFLTLISRTRSNPVLLKYSTLVLSLCSHLDVCLNWLVGLYNTHITLNMQLYIVLHRTPAMRGISEKN